MSGSRLTSAVRLIAFSALVLAPIMRTGAATSNGAADANGRTEVLFLGTGGGPPLDRDRSKPATLLIVDGRDYLIDCGIGTLQQMLNAGIISKNIGTIFFTHLHSDHDLGLADVMANDYFQLRLAGAPDRISIYGPPQTREFVEDAFRYVAVSVRPFAVETPESYPLVNGALASPFVTHEFGRDGVIFQDDKIRVIAAENSHYARMSEQDRGTLKSYSYRIETPHGVVVFTGDTGPSDAVVRLAKGADVLIAEASGRDPADLDHFVNAMAARNHWSAERSNIFRAHFLLEHLDTKEIGQLAAQAQVKAVLLYHYDPADKIDQAAYVAGIKKYFDGPVFAPDDLDRFCIDAPNEISTAKTVVVSRCRR
jgi:ribonuclease BN (tRNA processing enzyme)